MPGNHKTECEVIGNEGGCILIFETGSLKWKIITENYSELFRGINDPTTSWLLNYIIQKELNGMLLSLLLTDRILAVNRQTKSAFIIATGLTPAKCRPQLISGKCYGEGVGGGNLSSTNLTWWTGNFCLCHLLSFTRTGWAGPQKQAENEGSNFLGVLDWGSCRELEF